jgi:hypothetical protein
MLPTRALLHLLPPSAWRAFLAHFDARLPPKARDADAIALYLATASLPAAAANALDAVCALASHDARRDLVVCARAHAYDLGRDAMGRTPAELAIRVVLSARTDKNAALVVERARLHGERRPPPYPTRDFLPAGDLPTPNLGARALTAIARDVEAAVGAVVGKGKPVAHALHVPRADGFTLDLLRPGPARAELAFVDGQVKASSYAQVFNDVITWHASRRRLRIATADPALVRVLLASVGRHVFGSEHAFSPGPSVTLAPFRTLGAAALDTSRFGASFKGARLVRLVWDWGGDDVLVVRGRNVFSSVEARGLPLALGYFVGAVVRLDLARGGHVDVVMKPPNRVHWAPGPWDAAVAAWLDAGPLLSMGDERVDVWTHFGATMREIEWLADHGATWVEARKKSGALVAAETRVLAHPEHASAKRALLAFYDDAAGGYAFAEDDDDDVPALVVGHADLGAQKIDPSAYAREIAALVATVLPGVSAPSVVDARLGLFDLGEVALGGERLRLFVAIGPATAGELGSRMPAMARPAHAVLLLPPGRKLASGAVEAAWPESTNDAKELVRVLARALGAGAKLPVLLAAPKGARFAIDEARREAYLDGVELVKLADNAFMLLVLMARAAGAVVTTKDVNDALVRSRDAEAAKKARARLAFGIVASFELAGQPLPKDLARMIVVGPRGGYRLTVEAYIR